MRRTSLLFTGLTLLTVVLVGCRQDEIKTYRVAKEAIPAHTNMPATQAMGSASSSGDMASTAVTTAAGPGLTWTAPTHWESRPASAMRKATFVITDGAGATADLSVTAFPGDVGGTLANVNRWRNQIQLDPISEADLGSALKHLDVGDLHVDFVELVGPGNPPSLRVLGALVPFNGSTWFFKLTGPDTLVAREKAAYLSFLQSLRPQG